MDRQMQAGRQAPVTISVILYLKNVADDLCHLK